MNARTTVLLVLLVMMVLLLGHGAWAQQSAPALVFQDGEKSHKPLAITKVDIEVKVLGSIAETKMTMVFHNDLRRALAGDLYFPLPEGATVSGYGLDVNGTMVDGVAVTKEKGRQVFEKEVRKGVDPGLVEWAKGNNFKTRVFPIPAGGDRTVMVKYVSDIVTGAGGPTFHLPLAFKDKVKDFHLRVEVVKGEAKPTVVKGAPGAFVFGKWRDSFVAETTLNNAAVDGELVIALPDAERKPVFVEKASDGAYYFFINDLLAASPGKGSAHAKELPRTVTIFWDASSSRGKGDHAREREIVKSFFASYADAPVTVSLVLFRNEASMPREFKVEKGDASALVKAIQEVRYDGGTQMGCLRPTGAECYFLFTDGISNFGVEDPEGLDRPVYIFTADPSANHPFLNYLAVKTGGAYLNLNRLTNEQALAGIGGGALTFMGAQFDGQEIGDVYPATGRKVHGPFTLAGKLKGKKGTVTARYGVNGKVVKSHEFVVSADGAAEGDELRWEWAQKKVDDLMIFQERNEEEITATGLKYGLVTSGTSLIVLETLEQYVEHNIEPPACLPEMRNKWLARMDELSAEKKKGETDKLDHVMALWKSRVAWWEQVYKYPENFKYREAEPAKTASAGGRGGAARETYEERQEGAPPPAPRAERPADAPAPTTSPSGGRPSPQDNGAEEDEKKKDKSGEDRVTEPGVVVKEWDPGSPYVKALKAAKSDERFAVYMAQKEKHGASPAFYLECASFFNKSGDIDTAVQVLSNIAEMELENAALLRILAHRLWQIGKLDLSADTFGKVLKMRPEEPQSHRDLALVLARRAQWKEMHRADLSREAVADYTKAMELLAKVVMNRWDRFDEIEVIALMDLNGIIPRAQKLGLKKLPLDERLVRNLALDIRILLTWDADMTDMDLHVTEPSGEKAYYGHNRTTIGGLVSRDFTQGYGPEEYCLRKAMHGVYKIEVNYYGSSAATLQGPVTVQAEVITHFGRPNEKRQSLTLQLTEKKDTFLVGEIEF